MLSSNEASAGTEKPLIDACEFLSIEKPVLQGAMGSVARHDLVVAVSKAGGLGTLSYLPPKFFASELQRVEESLGDTTFAINLLMPVITRAHVDICLESSASVVTIFYGFDQEIVTALKDKGKTVLFQVGSLNEAKKVVAAGADGVIAQGFEAGGHIRGSTRLADLLPQIKDALPDHFVAGAGGIHDAGSADACRAIGADAVTSGTRFLASPEAAAHEAYKQRLIDADDTVATNLFGLGWRDPHRVIVNGAVKKWCKADGREPAWLAPLHGMAGVARKLASARGGGAAGAGGGPSFIAKQSLDKPLYSPASLAPGMSADLIEVTALYAGECVREVHDLRPASETVAELAGRH